MKFILSPSKTMAKPRLGEKEMQGIRPETEALLRLLRDMPKEEAGRFFKLKDQKLEIVCSNYQHFETLGCDRAIELYEGSVFKGIQFSQLEIESQHYLESHLLILSAFYGPLRPLQTIKPYRLDLTMPIFKKLPSDYWHRAVNEALETDERVVNLASDEFSKLVTKPMIHIIFAEGLGTEKLTVKSTYAKMARGQMVHFAARHLIETPEALKTFNWGGYVYQPDLEKTSPSGDRYWTFARV